MMGHERQLRGPKAVALSALFRERHAALEHLTIVCAINATCCLNRVSTAASEKTFSSNAAQRGLLVDAYSTIVTHIGQRVGWSKSAAVAFCVLATSTRWSDAKATKAASPALTPIRRKIRDGSQDYLG